MPLSRRLRPARRSVAIVLALLMVVGSLDAYHLAKDDPGVLPGSIVGHLTQQLWGPAQGELPNPHCAICYWLRSLGTSQIAHIFVNAPPTVRVYRLDRRHLPAPRVVLTHSPARAPPVYLTLS